MAAQGEVYFSNNIENDDNPANHSASIRPVGFLRKCCPIFSILMIALFLSINFAQFSANFSNVGTSYFIANFISFNNAGVVSNNITAVIAETSTNVLPKSPVKADDPFWQFELTERRHDNDTDIPTKIVLLWTLFFGPWADHLDRNHGAYTELEIYNCEKRCYFTQDRNLLPNASALLFHPPDINYGDFPKQRWPWQRWIFYLLESPMHARISGDQWSHLNGYINWTMGYPKAADVYFPYGIVRKSKTKLNEQVWKARVNGFAKSFKTRPKDAVWVVSNCWAPSGRQQYVEKLKALGVTVDIFGNCGQSKPDEQWQSEEGEHAFYSRYRFVLAPENSLCDDYITEKAFHAFYANFIAGPIPILYSGANYSDFFVDGSYLNMRTYKNLGDLAKFIIEMRNADENNSKLMAFYEWQKTVNPAYDKGYEIESKYTDMYVQDYSKRAGWRNLCRALWDHDTGTGEKTDFETSVINDIPAKMGQCYPTDMNTVNSATMGVPQPMSPPLTAAFRRKRAESRLSWRGYNPDGSVRYVAL